MKKKVKKRKTLKTCQNCVARYIEIDKLNGIISRMRKDTDLNLHSLEIRRKDFEKVALYLKIALNYIRSYKKTSPTLVKISREMMTEFINSAAQRAARDMDI